MRDSATPCGVGIVGGAMAEHAKAVEESAGEASAPAAAARAQPFGQTLDPAGMIMLQRGAGNRAATRVLAQRRAVLARQEKPPDALPQPDRGPEHQKAFDAFVDEMNTGATGADAAANVKRLQDMRAIVDVDIAASSTVTLTLPGHQLVVDRRNQTAVMTRLRWRAMDLIHDQVEAVLTGQADPAKPLDEGQRAALRASLGAKVKPYLDYLRGEIKNPESKANRFEHWRAAVTASTLYALQALAAESAQAIGTKPDGSFMTRADLEKDLSRMGDKAWCGAFANLALRHAGLLGKGVGFGQLDHERGIVDLMTYADAGSGQDIVVGDRKVAVEEYHAERGSKRRIQVITDQTTPEQIKGLAFAPAKAEFVPVGKVEIHPGDILLLDRDAGGRPDHIMMASDYDAKTHKVSKIAGNEVSKEGQVNTGTWDISAQPDQIAKADHDRLYEPAARLKEARALHDSNAATKGTPWADAEKLKTIQGQIAAFEGAHPEFYEATGKKRARLAAVCSFSVVDFETHPYVPRQAAPRTLARALRRLQRAASPEVETAERMAPLLDDDAQAPKVIEELNGQWIQIMVFVLKLLVERHGKKDRLLKFAPAAPGVLAALNTVLNPEAAKANSGLDILIDDQKAQMRGFARRREWPTAIRKNGETRPAELDDPLSEMNGIIAAIHHEREAVEDTMSANWVPPKAKVGGRTSLTAAEVEALTPAQQRQQFVANDLGGYMKTTSSDSRDPTDYAARGNVAEADKERIKAINKVVWEELGHEGDAGSINTYDNAVLTWGKGWAGLGGRLPALMKQLPENIKNRLLDIGVAYEGDWLALGVGDRVVFKGPEALQYIRFNTKILSAMYALGQGTEVQGLVDAQAKVMFNEFDQLPAALRTLDDRLIMVVVHCCWWGHMTMGKAAGLVSGKTTLADQLREIVRWQSQRGGTNDGEDHGARVVTGWQASLFHKMGRGVIAATFTERAAAPADAHAGKTLIKPPGAREYIVV